jgi:hypothetical protein
VLLGVHGRKEHPLGSVEQSERRMHETTLPQIDIDAVVPIQQRPRARLKGNDALILRERPRWRFEARRCRTATAIEDVRQVLILEIRKLTSTRRGHDNLSQQPKDALIRASDMFDNLRNRPGSVSFTHGLESPLVIRCTRTSIDESSPRAFDRFSNLSRTQHPAPPDQDHRRTHNALTVPMAATHAEVPIGRAWRRSSGDVRCARSVPVTRAPIDRSVRVVEALEGRVGVRFRVDV